MVNNVLFALHCIIFSFLMSTKLPVNACRSNLPFACRWRRSNESSSWKMKLATLSLRVHLSRVGPVNIALYYYTLLLVLTSSDGLCYVMFSIEDVLQCRYLGIVCWRSLAANSAPHHSLYRNDGNSKYWSKI